MITNPKYNKTYQSIWSLFYKVTKMLFRKELHITQLSQTYKTTLSTSPPSSTQVTS